MSAKLANQRSHQEPIILNSGHILLPKRIEKNWRTCFPRCSKSWWSKWPCGYLCALTTGTVEAVAVSSGARRDHLELPHYRQIRKFHILPDVFSPETVLTANGKLRRDAINARYAPKSRYVDSKGVREAANRQHA